MCVCISEFVCVCATAKPVLKIFLAAACAPFLTIFQSPDLQSGTPNEQLTYVFHLQLSVICAAQYISRYLMSF